MSIRNKMIDLKNKKVTVMGLGLFEEGSGISATKFLVEAGAKVTVTDLKSAAQLAEQLKRLDKSIKGMDSRRRGNDVKFVLGRHNESDFKSADLIVRNPGVPKASKFLALARKNKIPVVTDISLFFELIERKRIIGVTGTRGKSTTTTLLYDFIKTIDKQTVIGGNITKSPLAQMPQVKKGGMVILELSSWLLESLADIKKSPHIAIFTNIYPDHLNTYTGIEDYAEAKKNIFKFQTLQDYVILNRDNAYTKKMGSEVVAQRYWFSLKPFKEENGCFLRGGQIVFRSNGLEQKVCSIKELQLPGEHNQANALAAVCAAMIFGIKPVLIKKVLRQFKGVPNRLELLREINGVKYYNDTTSTTPEATFAALQALGKKKNIVLIAGGSDKGLDFKQVVKEIKSKVKGLVLLNGTGTERLEKEFGNQLRQSNYAKVDSMADAVGVAKSFAKRRDIILLSPACASFGMFINEFDRGDQFRQLVKDLK